MTEEKSRVNIVVIGHVKSGKSADHSASNVIAGTSQVTETQTRSFCI